jgi:hypothetical protein
LIQFPSNNILVINRLMNTIQSDHYLIIYVLSFLDIITTVTLSRTSRLYYKTPKLEPDYAVKNICKFDNEDGVVLRMSTWYGYLKAAKYLIEHEGKYPCP